MDLTGKQVAVLGLGKSGFESARFLAAHGARVWASESKASSFFPEVEKKLKSLHVQVEFGKHSLEQIQKSNFIVISPGISPKTEIYQAVNQSGILLMSEVELASRFCPCPIVAVTGTNGKTTVTTLIQKVLAENGCHAVSCGNIGNPFIGEIKNLRRDSVAVLEVSSFQLANIQTFRPHIAVLLNLTDNHYDWHGTFQAYADAKWNIFKNQMPEDFAILNADDAETKKRESNVRAKKKYFKSTSSENPNYEACLEVAQIFKLNEVLCRKLLKEFRGIEHRMENVNFGDGVNYINDSKSTTIASLGWALDRMNKKVVLIMGGLHKGGDFSQLQNKVKEKVKSLVVIGKASLEIEHVFRAFVSVQKAASLEDALRIARSQSKIGDTILFSPACASFDMFRDYEDRGRQFKEIVARLQKEVSSKAFSLG